MDRFVNDLLVREQQFRTGQLLQKEIIDAYRTRKGIKESYRPTDTAQILYLDFTRHRKVSFNFPRKSRHILNVLLSETERIDEPKWIVAGVGVWRL